MELFFQYKELGNTQNLILDLDKSVELSSFSLNMMNHNQIKYVVPVQLNRFNQNDYLQFDISGMTRLSSKLKEVLPKEEVLHLLNSIMGAFEEVDSYMLSVNSLYLDLNYIFLDENNDCYFLFLPFNEPVSEETIFFLHRLVEAILPDYTSKDPYLFDLMNAFSRGGIRKLEDFKELLRKKADKGGGDIHSLSERTRQNEGEIIPSANPEKEKNDSNAREGLEKTERKDKAMSGFPFNIPGMKRETNTPSNKDTEKKKKDKISEAKIPVLNIPGKTDSFELPRTEQKQNSTELKKPAVKLNIPGKEKDSVVLPEKKKKEEKEKPEKGFFGRKLKPNKDKAEKIVEVQNRGNSSVYSTESQAEEMYEGYEKTIILETNTPEAEDMEGTVLIENIYPAAELVRKSTGEHIELTELPAIVGAGTLANCKIENNKKISRRHATITCHEGSFYIMDNGSSNGTAVNGKTLTASQREKLDHNMTIRLADEEFIFKYQ